MPDSTIPVSAVPMARLRSAVTLVEVLGTLSVLLVLGVSAVSILGSITQVGVHSSRSVQTRASVERLAQKFRRDVHQASEVTASREPLTVDLTHQSVTVRYRWHENLKSISRSTSEGDKQLSIDMFQLPEDFQPSVSVKDSLVVLRLNDPQGQGTENQGPQWVIEVFRS